MGSLAPTRHSRALARRRPLPAAPWALAGAAVLAEVAYPLVPAGRARDRLTVGTVVVFASASLAHATATRGGRAAAALLAVAGGGGLAAEVVGTRTGRPFGRYAYGASLGPRVAGVPVVIGLAWTMMAWPSLVVGRRLGGRRAWAVPLVAGYALASWDVFLDPQMVDAGHWHWTQVGTALPGVPDVPLTNFAGWLAVAVVLSAALDRCVPRAPASDAQPYALYLWTYASSVLANLAFWRRPGVAAAGGVAMGVVALPLARTLRRGR
jgi:putative membrane protein